ncbi:unnamed protein product [Chondrus crispus]|uniref:E3 ubiquitin-protein ligase listerin n=1 Tax=Chondrus crispus TaxID=2769 RepID=R7QV20_CHOCR|nr:unnamed protein product [Chondrus crispus]CDF41326.1 unnamed protein product [Chondrus crispus]|eukprot:XP_005711620.1 unnamed protein product [Chondrus crispus]
MLLARGPKQKRTRPSDPHPAAALPEACQLALAVLPHMRHDVPEDRRRADRFAAVALLGIRRGEPTAWDLALVLLTNGWSDAFAPALDPLADAVGEAVTTKFPTGLPALLPLLDALPPARASAALAETVLDRMKHALTPPLEKRQTSNVPYVLAALPTYMECATFARGTGCDRWFEEEASVQLRVRYAADVFSNHISPTFEAFACGRLPPIASRQSQSASGTPRRRARGNTNHAIQALSVQVARSLRGLEKDVLDATFETVAKSFVSCLDEKNPEEPLDRYLQLLNCGEENAALPSAFGAAVLLEIIKTRPGEMLATHTRVLSLALSSKAFGSGATSSTSAAMQFSSREFSSELMAYVKAVLRHLEGTGKSQDMNENGYVRTCIGEAYSWMYWVANADEKAQVLDQIIESVEPFDNEENTLCLLGEFLRAHRRRRERVGLSQWTAIKGPRLEGIVVDAANRMHKGDSVHALSFVTTASDPQGGACMPLSVLRRVAEVSMQQVQEAKDRFDCDELLVVLLRSPAKYMDSEQSFKDLLDYAFLRAVASDAVYAQVLCMLLLLAPATCKEHVCRMIALVTEQSGISGKEGSEDNVLRAKIIVQLVSDTSQHVGSESVAICEEILSRSNPQLTHELLQNASMSIIFGNGSATDVRQDLRHDLFLDTFEEVSVAGGHDEIEAKMQTFLQTRDPQAKSQIARLAAARILHGSNEALCRLLFNTCHESVTDTDEWTSIANGIAEELLLSFPLPKGGDTRNKFSRVPLVVRVCIAASDGAFLDSFKELVETTVKMVRRDPLALDGQIALDILSAAFVTKNEDDNDDFSVADTSRSSSKLPDWLLQSAMVVLVAVRRCLERPLAASKTSIELLEKHGACFFASLLRRASLDELRQDDLRFWALRTRDILRYYTRMGASTSKERLASASTLGAALVELTALGQVVHPDVIDEICHYAGWAAALLLSGPEASGPRNKMAGMSLLKRGSVSSSNLVLKAVERGVFLGLDGEIPIDIETVYDLAPQLASHNSFVRKAVLTLLSFAAAVDLPEKVADAFPKDGFSDEAKEIKFVTNQTPAPLRLALEWPHIEGTSDPKESADFAVRELGYFLAWRLFLDLIKTDEQTGSVELDGDVQEDVSFRRVGITFLRSRPELYAQFFNKCVEVVVDGSMTERVAAGMAAAEALQVEERAAQGMQLVRPPQDSQDDETEPVDVKQYQFDADSAMDEEVGKAAGIAFARALQRLPALSRQHVTDSLDRGTALRVESFVRKKISPLLIAAEIRKVKEWGAFGGGRTSLPKAGPSSSSAPTPAAAPEVEGDGDGELSARGSVAGREVWATYTFSDVTLEIGMRLPDVFPLNIVEVEARSRIGMSEARWRKTLLGMTTLLRAKDGTLAEAVELWRRNLDKTFQGAEECPICYSVLHLTTAALPRMQCRTCKNLFHSECLCKWFTKSNSSACPLCRSAF